MIDGCCLCYGLFVFKYDLFLYEYELLNLPVDCILLFSTLYLLN